MPEHRFRKPFPEPYSSLLRLTQAYSSQGGLPLILSLLWTQFLSREISYNFKVAIIGHLHCTDFDRNDRPISSL